MKKFFNNRLIFIYFVLVILGIIVSRVMSVYEKFDWIPLVCLVIISLCVWGVSLFQHKRCGRTCIHVALSMLVLIMSIVSTNIATYKYEKDSMAFESGNYVISGEVTSINYDKNFLYIDNVYINEEIKINGAARVRFNGEIPRAYSRGDLLTTACYAYTYNSNEKIDVLGVSVEAKVINDTSVSIVKSNKLRDKYLRQVRDILYDTNDSATIANLEYAMLFGDKDRLDHEIKDSYSISGMSHILAISGLHIGFVVALLYKLLSLIIKNKHWLTLVISSSVILLYLYLCNFAVSAVRAVIMTTIIYYAKARGKMYDPLCGLSGAGILILLLNPLDLFNIGFQLSFSVVFALFALSPPIKGILSKVMPQKLASSLATTLSAFTGSIAIVAYYFGNCSAIAILANLIIIPFVSISFTILFVLVNLAAIFPFLKILTIVPNLLFNCINVLIVSISKLPIVAFKFTVNMVGVLLSFIFLYIASDYIFLKKRIKACVLTSIVSLMLMVVVYCN